MMVHEVEQEAVILVCSESHCKKNGCKKVCERLKQVIRAEGLKGAVRVQRTKCMGHCGKGPNVLVYPARTLYTGVDHKHDIEQIVEEAVGVSAAC